MNSIVGSVEEIAEIKVESVYHHRSLKKFWQESEFLSGFRLERISEYFGKVSNPCIELTNSKNLDNSAQVVSSLN